MCQSYIHGYNSWLLIYTGILTSNAITTYKGTTFSGVSDQHKPHKI